MAGVLGVCAVAPVLAQTESRTTTVMDRPRPELDALGVRAGGFLVYPSVTLSEAYNDNIFATQTDTKDDFITTVTPEVRANSDWNVHSLQFQASGTVDRHATNSAEDTEEFTVGTNGRLDIRRDTNATAGLQYQSLTEDRGSPDDVNGSEPTEYTLGTANAGFFNRWNRVSLNAGARVRQYDYDDVPTSAGATINNDDRDRDEYRLSLRGGYQIQENYEAFLEGVVSRADYDADVDDNGINRDSDGYEFRAGARIDFTGLVFGDFYASYITRDYDDPTLTNFDGVGAGADMTWNVTQLTTVTGTVSRQVAETTLASASGNLRTNLAGRVDHELLRNLILSGRLGVSRDEFEGTTREDDYLRGMLQARYMMNRNLYFTLRYEYTDRDSSSANADYDRNIVFLRLRAQL